MHCHMASGVVALDQLLTTLLVCTFVFGLYGLDSTLDTCRGAGILFGGELCCEELCCEE